MSIAVQVALSDLKAPFGSRGVKEAAQQDASGWQLMKAESVQCPIAGAV